MLEVRRAAVQKGLVPRGTPPVVVLQTILDAAYDDWLMARDLVDRLPYELRNDADAIRLQRHERELRQDAFKMAQAAAALGLAERQTRVQEQLSNLFLSVLQEACRAVGIPEAQVKLIPGAALQILEGTASAPQEAAA